jgi:hypothetical protein
MGCYPPNAVLRVRLRQPLELLHHRLLFDLLGARLLLAIVVGTPGEVDYGASFLDREVLPVVADELLPLGDRGVKLAKVFFKR